MQNDFGFALVDGLPTCGSIRSGYSLDSAALGVCAKAEAIQRLLTIYWRVSSLLAITIYLLIAALPVGFISGLMARIIPISLWFWVDLNEEIEDQPRGALNSLSTRGAGRLLSIVCWVRSLSYLCCSVLSLKT